MCPHAKPWIRYAAGLLSICAVRATGSGSRTRLVSSSLYSPEERSDGRSLPPRDAAARRTRGSEPTSIVRCSGRPGPASLEVAASNSLLHLHLLLRRPEPSRHV